MTHNYRSKLEKETALIAYLDLANMFHWQEVLKWRFRIEDVVSGLTAMTSVKEVKIYHGLNGRKLDTSMAFQRRLRKAGATLRTKPVKWIRKPITERLFMKQSTLGLFDGDITTKVTNLADAMRQTGVVIEEPKCNFDVEMTMDLLDDAPKVSAVLVYSGDSDMRPVLERLKIEGKHIYVVGVRGMVGRELFEIADTYIDFGKLYRGKRTYPNSQNAQIPPEAGPRD